MRVVLASGAGATVDSRVQEPYSVTIIPPSSVPRQWLQVSNFKYYDATYTERYMGAAGADAYENTDLMRNVTGFHKVPYLVAHGTGDDNVHFQNTAELVRALTEDNVQFEMMIYTDESHSIAGGRWHLYNLLQQFFARCFAP